MSQIKQAVQALQKSFKDNVLSVEEFRGQTTVNLNRDVILDACKLLHDDEALQFDFLAALTAVDYFPQQPRFAVVYQLYSIPNRIFLGLRVPLQNDSAEIESVETVYANANWHEREIFDMFGISFKGHSDLRRILMPKNWEGHPLRKDYPLGYEEVQFSFNFDEIDDRKPYAKE
jgi:NADH-quinone oxidoreductase subunit C